MYLKIIKNKTFFKNNLFLFLKKIALHLKERSKGNTKTEYNLQKLNQILICFEINFEIHYFFFVQCRKYSIF